MEVRDPNATEQPLMGPDPETLRYRSGGTDLRLTDVEGFMTQPSRLIRPRGVRTPSTRPTIHPP
jgi:hypothetical protein